MAGRRSRTVLDDLTDEWRRLEDDSSTVTRFHRWCALFPELARHGSLPALVGWCRDRSAAAAERDRAMLALATLAVAGDELAGRSLLEAVTPALHRMVATLTWVGESREERAQLVVTAAWERIRTYPVARRPGKVAPNIVADTRHAVSRAAGDGRADHAEALGAEDRTTEEPDSATLELWRLLSDAVSDGVLTATAASLIARSRIFDESMDALAAAGEPAQTVRRRRQRAERRLRSALADGLSSAPTPTTPRARTPTTPQVQTQTQTPTQTPTTPPASPPPEDGAGRR